MAWTLDQVTVRVQPILEDLTYARYGATHMLTVMIDAHGPAGTLSNSIPLPVRVGDPVQMPKDPMGLREWIYGWNGSVSAPTLTPDVREGGRGAAHFNLTDGLLTPLPSNRETLLTGPVRVSEAERDHGAPSTPMPPKPVGTAELDLGAVFERADRYQSLSKDAFEGAVLTDRQAARMRAATDPHAGIVEAVQVEIAVHLALLADLLMAGKIT